MNDHAPVSVEAAKYPCRQLEFDPFPALFPYEIHKDNSVTEPGRCQYRRQLREDAFGFNISIHADSCAQNAAMKRLFDLKECKNIEGFLLPYLGQNDKRLKYQSTDLVSREEAYAYPTDFSAMPEEWIEKLSKRGEQLTKALIAEHMPELISAYK